LVAVGENESFRLLEIPVFDVLLFVDNVYLVLVDELERLVFSVRHGDRARQLLVQVLELQFVFDSFALVDLGIEDARQLYFVYRTAQQDLVVVEFDEPIRRLKVLSGLNGDDLLDALLGYDALLVHVSRIRQILLLFCAAVVCI